MVFEGLGRMFVSYIWAAQQRRPTILGWGALLRARRVFSTPARTECAPYLSSAQRLRQSLPQRPNFKYVELTFSLRSIPNQPYF
jgi:hypothetical protein